MTNENHSLGGPRYGKTVHMVRQMTPHCAVMLPSIDSVERLMDVVRAERGAAFAKSLRLYASTAGGPVRVLPTLRRPAEVS